jgi:signal transduction histidine kinase
LDANGRHVAAEDWPLTRALQGQHTHDKEYRLSHLGGICSEIVFNAGPIKDENDQIMGAFAMLVDITHQKQVELKTRDELLEKQCTRMAADLHDTVCQHLAAILLQLRIVESEMPRSPNLAQQHLRFAQDFARDSLNETRRSICTLSQESLEGQDLAQALSLIAHQLFAATSVKVKLALQPESKILLPEMRRELIRIGREALSNVLKHAKATKVRLVLNFKPREVQLRVYDNGQGFTSPGAPNANGGYGLTSMSRRAKSLGGAIVVHSEPGRGTRVIARVPLAVDVLQRAA